MDEDDAPVFGDDGQLPDDHGLSLDDLAEAFADLMRQGDDPYEQPAEDSETLPGDPEPDRLWPALSEDADVAPDGDPATPVAPRPLAEATARLRREAAREDAAVVAPRSIVEAALFVGRAGGGALDRTALAAVMRGVTPDEVDAIVTELNAEYAEAGCPYRIEATGEGLRLAAAPPWDGLGRRLAGRTRDVRLSQAAVDVLAIVAYHQPITREGVDQIRGRASGSLLAGLLRRDLIEVATRGVASGGRPYRTTDRFLALFGLASPADLPRSDESDPG